MAAPKRVKPPVEKAEYQIQKQIEAIKASTLPEKQQAQLVAYFTGLSQAMLSVEQVADPENPPSPDSVYGKLIALGRSKLALGTILTGGLTAPSSDGQGQGQGAGSKENEPADVGI